MAFYVDIKTADCFLYSASHFNELLAHESYGDGRDSDFTVEWKQGKLPTSKF